VPKIQCTIFIMPLFKSTTGMKTNFNTVDPRYVATTPWTKSYLAISKGFNIAREKWTYTCKLRNYWKLDSEIWWR
jgi:hypothetical protein